MQYTYEIKYRQNIPKLSKQLLFWKSHLKCFCVFFPNHFLLQDVLQLFLLKEMIENPLTGYI